jgi:hypothetical protein
MTRIMPIASYAESIEALRASADAGLNWENAEQDCSLDGPLFPQLSANGLVHLDDAPDEFSTVTESENLIPAEQKPGELFQRIWMYGH